MKFEWARIAVRAEGHFRNLGCPPKGELASLRLDDGPDGTPFANHMEPEEIAVKAEGLLHVFHREEDVTDVLDESHAPAMGLRRYMKPPCAKNSTAVRRNLNRPEVPSRHSHASRRRTDRGVLRVGGHGAPRVDRAGPQESRGDRGRPRRHTGSISRADRSPHPRERSRQLAPGEDLHPRRRDDRGGPRESVEGEASLAAARRLARCGPSEGPPARLLWGAEGVASSRPDRRAGRGSPTAARPIPRGVPLHRIPDPAAKDAGGTA